MVFFRFAFVCDKQSVLHDWIDQDCVKILERCKEAITRINGRKRKVIIIEMLINEYVKGDEVQLK